MTNWSVDLTSLVMSLDDDAIRIRAHVTKSGFCYDADGDVTAWLRIQIRDGRLQASAEIGDPDVDVDIPWYCWLAAAVIGALIGGILIGVIGAIVGVVLVPLIIWLATEVIEGTIDQVADEIVDAINESVPDIDVPAFGVNILFQDVFIDDVVLKAALSVVDNSPVRAQGTVRLYPGQGLDLDTGEKGGANLASADILWMGNGYTRRLETGCQAGLAHTGWRDLDNMPKYRLYSYNYQTNTSVSIWDLGAFNPFGVFFGDEWDEYRFVLAIRTNEGRYSIIQVTEIDDDWILVRYKTFETAQSSVQIYGNFRCIRFARPADDAVAWFQPAAQASAAGEISAAPRAQAVGITQERLSDSKTAISGAGLKGISYMYMDFLGGSKIKIAAERVKGEKETTSECSSTTTNGGEIVAVAVAERVQAFPLGPFYDGRWVAEVEVSQDAHARLRAVATGMQGEAKFIWSVGVQVLQDGTSGQIEVYETKVSYAVDGANLLLSVSSDAVIELFVQVTVVDDRGCSAKSARCVTHDGTCTTLVRAIASSKQFRALQSVAPATVAPGLVSTVSLPKVTASTAG